MHVVYLREIVVLRNVHVHVSLYKNKKIVK